jgi:hypothetical protein
MLSDSQLEKLLETRAYDRPRTKTMRNFLKREAPHRVTGLSIEPDGVFIYTDSEKWSDDSGAGTFREDSETEAIKYFRSMVQPSILTNPRHRKKTMRKKKRKGNPERITQSWLEKRVALINSMMGNPEAAYTKQGSGAGGSLKQNQGHLYIDHAYGGVGLEEMARSGANAVSGGHVPKRELNTFLDGMIAALRLIDQRKRGRNPLKRRVVRKRQKPKKKDYVIFRIADKKNVMFLAVNSNWVGKASKGKFVSDNLAYAKRIAGDVANQYRRDPIGVAERSATAKDILASAGGKVERSGNPVGPTQREIDSAHNLFRDFTGEHPERMKNVRLPVPKTGLVIGELDGVLYTTIRDGKTEAYQHDFKKGSRPLLASSHDGSSLHILGGEYEFTERGIEDK